MGDEIYRDMDSRTTSPASQEGVVVSKSAPPSLQAIMKPGEVYIGRYFEVHLHSVRGRSIRREGKIVACGHEHRSEKSAEKCRDKMRASIPERLRSRHYPEVVEMHTTKIYKRKDQA